MAMPPLPLPPPPLVGVSLRGVPGLPPDDDVEDDADALWLAVSFEGVVGLGLLPADDVALVSPLEELSTDALCGAAFC